MKLQPSMAQVRATRRGGGKIGQRQFGLLAEMFDLGRPAEVADLWIDPANSRQALRGLERRGLVTSNRVPWKTRAGPTFKYVYELTAEGRRLGKIESDKIEAAWQLYQASLTPEQRATKKRLISEVRELMARLPSK